jgi:hypothetical protein
MKPMEHAVVGSGLDMGCVKDGDKVCTESEEKSTAFETKVLEQLVFQQEVCTESEEKSTAFETKVLEQLVFQQEVLAKIADRIFLVERMLFPAPVKLSTQMPAADVAP